MAEPLDSTPHGARSWTPEQIPPLARRLWLLFWLTAAQALAAEGVAIWGESRIEELLGEDGP